MKQLFITYIILLCAISGQSQSDLTVVVNNIKAIEGKVMVCLVDEKAKYLDGCDRGEMVQVQGNTEKVIFKNVTDGEYAVTIFHDKNNDDELNTNFVGIPKEPFGFSNNPGAMFGPPSYEKCLFQVKGDKSISIKL